jgi:hypothetical protein
LGSGERDVPYTDARAGSTVITLSAKSREEFVHDLVASLLEAAYGKRPEAGAAEGRVIPIQAAGADEAEILAQLAAGTLRAVRETSGRLLPPRWIALDEKGHRYLLVAVTARWDFSRPVGRPWSVCSDLKATPRWPAAPRAAGLPRLRDRRRPSSRRAHKLTRGDQPSTLRALTRRRGERPPRWLK